MTGTALGAASYRGHEAIVRLLIDRGAKVNVQGREYDNALLAASEHGHKVILQLLLDLGAEVSEQRQINGSHLDDPVLTKASERDRRGCLVCCPV